MTAKKTDSPKTGTPEGASQAARGKDSGEHEIEEYGGGRIKARRGRINVWLLIVYLVLIVWAIYYGFTYWGGLGPGLAY